MVSLIVQCTDWFPPSMATLFYLSSWIFFPSFCWVRLVLSNFGSHFFSFSFLHFLPWSFQQSPSGLFLSQGPCFESQRHKEESGRISGLESELSPYFQSSHLSCKRCECSSLWWFQPPATSVGHWYVCYQSRPWTTCRKEKPSPTVIYPNS